MDVVGRGTVLAGRYQLTEPLDCDLPGVDEWSALDQILVRPVVARVFPEDGAATALDAARRAALVADPRLVRVLDVGTDSGAGYVVTEAVTGPTLAQLVAREPLSADQARAVVGEAAAALETARRRGVHHLALRPSAIAVGDDGRVLVGGLALDATLLGRGGGDARVTSRTDATDLVRLVYAALTGHWPGPAETSDGLPVAPEADGAPVPPVDLVPGVPPDLNTLCAVTLGRDDDGPHSPAELVRELEPWGEIRVAGRPRTPPPPPPDTTTGTGQVVRQSVRAAFSGPTAAVNRPGTPPPAAPGRTGAIPLSATLPPGTPAAPAAPPGAPAFPPAVPPPGAMGPGPTGPADPGPAAAPQFPQSWAAGPPGDGDPFDFGQVEEQPPRRVGLAIGVGVIVLLVLAGVVLGIRALLGGLGGSDEPEAPPGSASPSASASPTTPTGQTPSQEPSPTGPGAAPGAVPTIAGITSVDLSDTAEDPPGEHEEAVGRAIDGDPATFWFTQTYNRDDFAGFKDGVGLELTLAEPATVRTVTLHVNGTGGHVEVRATDKANPTAGDVLASGALGPDTVLTLDPAPTTTTLVVWFTQLSANAEGKYRIELTELTLG